MYDLFLNQPSKLRNVKKIYTVLLNNIRILNSYNN